MGSRHVFLSLAAAVCAGTPAAAPDWLTLEGETRVRYESLGGQFRSGGAGGDQILAFRTLALVEADGGPVAVGLELQDSRALLDDAGTPLSIGIVNPADILQAYVRFDAGPGLGFKSARLKLGRQTLSLGSQRVLERVDMANVIFSYTGLHAQAITEGGDEWNLLAFVPTGRAPADRASLGEDLLSGDEEQWGRQAWGLHARFADTVAPGLWLETYLYGLHERDTAAVPTPNRDYLQPGFRLFRAPEPGAWDIDIEASRRFGSRRATAAVADTRDLKVSAYTLHAHIGRTFEHPWRPRVSLDYDFASGDGDSSDGRFEQFERLFGSRRTDLGHTGIHGPLTTVNIDAPGARIEVRPTPRSDLRLAYKAARLADPSDAWVEARVRDPLGRSGRFIGHTWDIRARVWIVPEQLQLELGAAALVRGRFARTAPGVTGEGDTLFGYAQLTQSF